MSKMWGKILLMVAVLGFWGSVAWAVPIVSIDLDPDTAGIQSVRSVIPPTSFSVDVVISGVDVLETLNAFELDVAFDPAILDPTSVVSGGFLLAPVFTVQMVLGALEVEFAEVTLLPFGASGSGVLATIGFDVIGVGTSVLDLNDVILSAPFGVEITPVTLNDGELNAIPEPATILLFGTGLAALVGWRYRKSVNA